MVSVRPPGEKQSRGVRGPPGGHINTQHAGVAQQVEQLICNQQVVGSTPATSSKLYQEDNNERETNWYLYNNFCYGSLSVIHSI